MKNKKSHDELIKEILSLDPGTAEDWNDLSVEHKTVIVKHILITLKRHEEGCAGSLEFAERMLVVYSNFKEEIELNRAAIAKLIEETKELNQRVKVLEKLRTPF